MRKAGNVDQVTILTGNDGSSIGCGIVVYQAAKDAQRAIRELQETELNGRPIRLREDRVGGGGGGGRQGGRSGRNNRNRSRNFGGNDDPVAEGTQLYVGNLSYDTTWKDLKDHFKQCGDVVRADVKTSDSGRSKGFGIVRFARREDAEKATKSLNDVELAGRPLDVRPDNKA
jgi:RNA recognition motif-containing protein